MAASRSIFLTYLPADCGSIIPGKSKAPQAFRDVDLLNKLLDAGIPNVSARQALDSPARYEAVAFPPGGVRNEDLNIFVCETVYKQIASNLRMHNSDKPHFQLIVGGECCMLPAILSAFWKHTDSQSRTKRIGLVYIDADTDLATPHDANSSGSFAGMNMTHLMRTPGALPRMIQFSQSSGEPVCNASNTVLFGINMTLPSNKPEHFAYLFDNGYQVVSSAAVAQTPEQCAAKALEYLEDTVDVIMVHLDVDSIDPRMFPLANVPNFTGVTFEQMMRALRVFLASEKIGGLTIAEVNPDHDPQLEMVTRLTDEIVGMLAARR